VKPVAPSGRILLPAAAAAWAAVLAAGFVVHRPPASFPFFPQGLGSFGWPVFLSAWGGHLAAAGWTVLWLLALAGWGVPVLGWAAPAARRGRLGRHFGLGAGFGLLGVAALGMGWTGLLAPGPLALAVLAPVAAGGWKAARDLARAAVFAIRQPVPGSGWAWRAAVVLPVAVALPAMLAPEVSWDAMVYHLRLPTFWLMEHRHFAQPDTPFTGYPCLTEAHYALVMAFSGGDRPAKLMHAACWLLTARVFFLAASPHGRLAAFGSALLWLGSPLGMLLAGTAYVDLTTAWLVALAAASAAGAAAAPGAPLLAGILCGFVFLTKFTGGFAFVGLLAFLWWRRRAMAAAAAGFAVPAFVWLARDWLALGNPVYPFATGILGGVSSATVEYWRTHPPAPGSGGLRNPLARLWLTAVADDAGAGAPPGGLWLAAFIPAAAAGLADRRWRFIAGAGLLWLLLPLDGRFLFPLIPAAILAVSPAWGTGWFRAVAGAALVVMVPVGARDALRTSVLQYDPIPPALGLRGYAEHMRGGLPPQPEYWEGAQLCNRRLPPKARLLFFSGIKSYRYDRRSTIPHQHLDPCPLLRELRLAGTSVRLAVRLRQSGFTHLVYMPRVAGSITDLPYVTVSPADAAGIVGWLRRFTAFDFRWGETLVYSLGRNPAPRPLGRVPLLEEYAMKEATHEAGTGGAFAIPALEKLAPESSTLDQTRGIMALMAAPSRPAEAVALLSRAVRSPEASPAAWRALGFALGETGDGGQALACYRQALELLPTDGQSHYGAGIILARAGRLEEAVAEFSAAIRADPGRPEFRRALDQVLSARR